MPDQIGPHLLGRKPSPPDDRDYKMADRLGSGRNWIEQLIDWIVSLFKSDPPSPTPPPPEPRTQTTFYFDNRISLTRETHRTVLVSAQRTGSELSRWNRQSRTLTVTRSTTSAR